MRYDLNGNTTTVATDSTGATGMVKEYHWDAENRLIKISYIDLSTTEFSYDGRSRRVRTVEKDSGDNTVVQKEFIWEGLSIAEEREGGVVTRQYFPQGEKRDTHKYYYGRDHLGSIRDVTDAAGALWRRYDYDAYGRTRRIDHLQATSSNGGPRLTRAVSRMSHGNGVGEQDVQLILSHEAGMGSEMRQAGSATLILSFDQPITSLSGLGVTGATASTETISGSSISIPITFSGDGEIKVELDEIIGSQGTTTDMVFKHRSLYGDANQDGKVDALDLYEWEQREDATPEAGRCHVDANRDGFINTADETAIQTSYTAGSSSEEIDFRYTGHYYHAKSGLYLAPYRTYNPILGRWINQDPIKEDGGVKIYGYVSNNPIAFSDPSGPSALGAALAGFGADLSVPEPTDLAWPKWAGWAVTLAAAAALDVCLNSDEVDPLMIFLPIQTIGRRQKVGRKLRQVKILAVGIDSGMGLMGVNDVGIREAVQAEKSEAPVGMIQIDRATT